MGLNVGRHIGTRADGEMKAEVTKNGNIHIWVEFDNPNKKDKPEVTVSPQEWDRLVAWVE